MEKETETWTLPAGAIVKFNGIPVRLKDPTAVVGNLADRQLRGYQDGSRGPEATTPSEN